MDKTTVESLVDKTFVLDCFQMELRQEHSETPIRVIGKGHVSQDRDGQLQFKLFSDKICGLDDWSQLRTSLSTPSGKIYEDREYFTLIIDSGQKGQWTAGRLFPKYNWNQDRAVVTGKVGVLKRETSTGEASDKYSIQADFVSNIDIPYVHMSETMRESGILKNKQIERDHASFDMNGHSFRIGKIPYGFSVLCIAQHPFPIGYEDRISEALHFIFARPVAWCSLITISGQNRIENIRMPPSINFSYKMRRPISISSFEHRAMTWRLFDSYLSHISRETGGNLSRALPEIVWNASEGSAGPVGMWALSICVATEAVSSLIHYERKSDWDNYISKLILSMESYLREFPPNNVNDRDRIIGSLNAIRQPRFQDRIKHLIDGGVIEKSHLQSWKEMRHRSAHGAELLSSREADTAMQAIINHIGAVTVLFYTIIFHAIGYMEQYTDYSVIGWPAKSVRVLSSPAAEL